ncbi:MAG: 4-hydroxy-tetrahydrodipicolinate reductase [Steroidobacteraceae bacterium]
MIRTVIVGASGRMGRNLIRLLPEFDSLKLTAAIVGAGSVALGRDAGELAGRTPVDVFVSCELARALPGAQLVIDFSHPAITSSNLAACVTAGVPLLIGTTGISEAVQAQFEAAARRIPLLVAANTSRGLNVLLELARRAAAALPESYDIEVLEAHHRSKIDAPSGSALALGAAVAEARGLAPETVAAQARLGLIGARPAGQVGFAVVRGGDVIGEHEVLFLGEGERLRLAHSVTDRAVFARGALEAGRWLAGQPAGRYRMGQAFVS